MFYTILDKKRKDILPFFDSFKEDFYLAGGTALALQLGHRDSIDFDFFSENDFNAPNLFTKLKETFKEHKLQKTQEEENTLTIIVDDTIKISFFTYKYTLLNPLHSEEYMRLASVEDIACMKLSAIISRSTEKDYVDLYFILQHIKLAHLLELASKKFPDLETSLILKSLVYFDDIESEPILFKNNKDVSFNEIKTFLQRTTKECLLKK